MVGGATVDIAGDNMPVISDSPVLVVGRTVVVVLGGTDVVTGVASAVLLLQPTRISIPVNIGWRMRAKNLVFNLIHYPC